MGYKSSASKKKLHGAGVHCAKKARGLSSVDDKLVGAGLACNQSIKRKETLYTMTKNFAVNALALAKRARPMIAKAKELERPTVIAQAGTTKAGYQDEQYRTIGPSNCKVNQYSTPIAETSSLYIIKPSLGKGLGMFATVDILKGTRIFAEKPFFCLAERPKLSESDLYAPNNISEAYERLSTSAQNNYMGLHCPERIDCSVIVSIYEANCYEMGSGTCICIDASRINHSCVPNAHYSWNDNIGRITVHAIKDICMDEEITISYCSAFRTLEQRRRKLKPYVFTCRCPACQDDTEFGSSSQNRRRQMRDLNEEIAAYQNDPHAARAEYGHRDEESAIRKIVRLIDEEGLVYEKALAYHEAAELAVKRRLKAKALEYASKEYNVEVLCNGRDSPFYKEARSFLRKIYHGRGRV